MARARILILCVAILGLLSAALAAQSLEVLYADNTGDTAYNIAVGEGIAYVSNNGGVSIYDFQDPGNPSLVAHPSWIGSAAFNLTLDGSVLYAVAPQLGSVIADVSNPAEPSIITQINDFIIAVQDGIAYAGGIGRPLKLFDVSNPASPTLLSELPWIGVRSVASSGDYAFVMHPARGVVQVDISDPTNPMELQTLRNTGGAYQLEIRDNRLYIAMYSRGVMVWELENPQYPTAIFGFSHTGEAWDVSGEYPILCVGDLQEGVEVLDASAPTLSWLILADPRWSPHSLWFEDGLVHLADQDDGYVLLRLHLASED